MENAKVAREYMIDIVCERLAINIVEYAEDLESGRAFIGYMQTRGFFGACKTMFENFPTFDEIYEKTINDSKLVDPQLIDEAFNFRYDMNKIAGEVNDKYVRRV